MWLSIRRKDPVLAIDKQVKMADRVIAQEDGSFYITCNKLEAKLCAFHCVRYKKQNYCDG